MTGSLPESEVRRLREKIYGPSSDQNWLACYEAWMKPAEVEWLKANAERGVKN